MPGSKVQCPNHLAFVFDWNHGEAEQVFQLIVHQIGEIFRTVETVNWLTFRHNLVLRSIRIQF